jgi:hypothetical protein
MIGLPDEPFDNMLRAPVGHPPAKLRDRSRSVKLRVFHFSVFLEFPGRGPLLSAARANSNALSTRGRLVIFEPADFWGPGVVD